MASIAVRAEEEGDMGWVHRWALQKPIAMRRNMASVTVKMEQLDPRPGLRQALVQGWMHLSSCDSYIPAVWYKTH